MNTGTIVSLIAILGSLILVWRGMRGRQVAPGRRVQMAVAWLVIIVGVVFALNMLGSNALLEPTLQALLYII